MERIKGKAYGQKTTSLQGAEKTAWGPTHDCLTMSQSVLKVQGGNHKPLKTKEASGRGGLVGHKAGTCKPHTTHLKDR